MFVCLFVCLQIQNSTKFQSSHYVQLEYFLDAIEYIQFRHFHLILASIRHCFGSGHQKTRIRQFVLQFSVVGHKQILHKFDHLRHYQRAFSRCLRQSVSLLLLQNDGVVLAKAKTGGYSAFRRRKGPHYSRVQHVLQPSKRSRRSRQEMLN